MIVRDLVQAMQDTGLELVLTGLIIIGMFMVGLWLGRWSLRMQLKTELGAWDDTKKEDTIRRTLRVNFIQGISTELFGAVMTTIAFGIVLLVFQQYQAVQNRKAELILQLGSPNNIFAVEAYRQVEALGWHDDGTLENTRLWNANLESAILWGSNFEGAILWGANLAGANLWDANLADTNLREVNLQGADLWDANLAGAILEDTDFNTMTILPDATHWEPETDMTRYTDPDHPDFWQPDWVKAGFDSAIDWEEAGAPVPDDDTENP